LLVEQNAMMTLELCDRAYVLERGRVKIEGTGSELARDPRVRAAYLGLGADLALADSYLSRPVGLSHKRSDGPQWIGSRRSCMLGALTELGARQRMTPNRR
jgi:hypothetical protein